MVRTRFSLLKQINKMWEKITIIRHTNRKYRQLSRDLGQPEKVRILYHAFIILQKGKNTWQEKWSELDSHYKNRQTNKQTNKQTKTNNQTNKQTKTTTPTTPPTTSIHVSSSTGALHLDYHFPVALFFCFFVFVFVFLCVLSKIIKEQKKKNKQTKNKKTYATKYFSTWTCWRHFVVLIC